MKASHRTHQTIQPTVNRAGIDVDGHRMDWSSIELGTFKLTQSVATTARTTEVAATMESMQASGGRGAVHLVGLAVVIIRLVIV